MRWLIVVGGVALLGILAEGAGWLAGREREREAAEGRARAAALAEQAAARRAAEARACLADRAELVALHAMETRAERHAQAAQLLEKCVRVTQDAEFTALQLASHVARLRALALDRSRSGEDRLASLSELQSLDLGAYHAMRQVAANVQSDLDRAAATKRREDLAERRRQGVRVGMTADDALKSSWGRPNQVNRTTFTWGVTEQWVYDGGYLYFTDGILTAISN